MESEFHITEYLGSSRDEMQCAVKRFYSDFIVKEISKDGTVCEVCCSNSADPVKPVDQEVDEEPIDLTCESPACVSQEYITQLDELMRDKTKSVTLPSQSLSKDERTKVHTWIRGRYRGKLQSQTSQTGDGTIMVSVSTTSGKRKRWPAGRPDFLHFTLSKENKDSQYALSIVAKFLGAKAANLGIRGTKDRRAVTAQRVSVYRYEADRVKQLNSRLRGIRLSDFNYEPNACVLGDLWGNRFDIVLRDLCALSDEEVSRRMNEFETKGFINYFGTQRFGSCGRNTADIGLAIIQRRWEDAVRIILSPRDDNGSLGDALKMWQETGNAAEALKKLSGSQAFASIESRVLSALTKGKHRNALLSLPRNTRSLYVHAYQSFIWNKIASKRICECGLKVLKGDIDVDGNDVNESDDFSRVALPLPSAEMKMPNNIVANWYKDLLKQDGVELEMFSALERDYVLASILRPIVVKPEGVEFSIVHYSNAETRLQPDLDNQVDEDGSESSGERKALITRFSLPSGTYATVALREITRCDMGKLGQRTAGSEDTDEAPGVSLEA